MEKILHEVLAEDKSLLCRRDELIAVLEKKVPGNLSRDLAPIKKALTLNIGEKFFVGEADRETSKKEIEEILKSSGMRADRINFVIETFAKALDWDKSSVLVQEEPKVEEPKVKVPPFSEVYRQQKEAAAQAAKSSEAKKNTRQNQGMRLPPPTSNSNSNSNSTSPPNSTPIQNSSDNKNKILIGLVCVLAAALLFVISGQSRNENSPTQNSLTESSTAQNSSTQSASVEDTSYRNAQTDLSLNGMDLGISVDELTRRIGRPLRIEKVDGYDRYVYSDEFYVTVVGGKVNAFVTRRPSDKTLRGLHVGSTYGEVIDKYGTNSKDMDHQGLTLHEYPFNSLDGQYSLLRFAINSSGRVEYISIRIVEEPASPKQENNSAIPENVKQAAAAFVSYHNAITNGNFPAAFDLFTDERKAKMDYNIRGFASGYSDTISSEVTDLKLVSNSGDTVVMNYILDARDRAGGGRILYQQFSGQVVMIRVGGVWKIASTESRRIKEVMER